MLAWRKAMEAGAATELHAEEPLVPASEVKQFKTQIRELERVLGGKTQENKILKEAVEIIPEKTSLARTLAGRWEVSGEGDRPGARSFSLKLLEQRSKRQRPPEALPEPEPVEATATRETAENGLLLGRIREHVGERPSYGCRRVTALRNRERSERVKPKRIYRIMRRNKLLLERCTGDGRRRKHDGVIITFKPDWRWCWDSFEIRCWSGERVHIAFVLDCCDREVTGFVAAPEPLCGEHVRDMWCRPSTTASPRHAQAE
jgi:putative transposase